MATTPSPGHPADLVHGWLAALNGVAAKLAAGADVADLGCGSGEAVVGLAQTYRRSFFAGCDPRPRAIEAARARAEAAGVADRVRFEVAGPATFRGSDYDLVTSLDGLRGVPDPAAAVRHVHDALAPDGTWMVLLPRPLADVPGALIAAAITGFTRVRRTVEGRTFVVVELRP